MNAKRKYFFAINFLEIFHLLIFILYILSIISIFSTKFRVFGASYFIFIWVSELAFGGECPITVEERILKKKVNESMKSKRFVPYLFKKYFNLKVSSKLGDYLVHFLFIVGLVIIVTVLLSSL